MAENIFDYLTPEMLRSSGGQTPRHLMSEEERILQSTGFPAETFVNPDGSPRQPSPEELGLETGSFMGGVKSAADAGSHVISTAVLEPLAGLIGLGSVPIWAIIKDPSFAGETVESVRGWAYEPKTQEGRDVLQRMGKNIQNTQGLKQLLAAIKKLEEIGKEGGKASEELGLPPIVSATVESVPQILPDALAPVMKAPKSLAKVLDTEIPMPRMNRGGVDGDIDTRSRIEPDLENSTLPDDDTQTIGDPFLNAQDPKVIAAAEKFGIDPETYAKLSKAQRDLLNEKLKTTEVLEAADAATTEKMFSASKQQQAAEDLAQQVEPDPQIVGAVEEMGFDVSDIPEGALSQNPQFRAVYGGLASQPGSQAQMKRLQLLQRMGEQADERMTEIAGALDRGQISDDLFNQMKEVREGLIETERNLYDLDLKQLIMQGNNGKMPIVKPNRTIARLQQRIDSLGGGVKDLTPLEKKIWGSLNEQNRPTWQNLDDMRKYLNSKDIDPNYIDQNAGELIEYQKLVRADQKDVADVFGAGEGFEAAMASTQMKKQHIDNMRLLFGKSLDKTLRRIMDTSTTNLQKGDVTEFRKIMNAIPQKDRKAVLINAIADKMIDTKTGAAVADPAKFAAWWNQLKRNQTAYAEIQKNLPDKAVSYLNNYAKLSTGLYKAGKDFINTGRINSMGEAFKAQNKAIDILVNGGAVGAGASTGSPMAGMLVGKVLKGIGSKEAAPLADRVADLMASPQFQMLVRDVALNTRNPERAAVMVEKLPAWKRYVSALSNEQAAKLERLGIVEFLKQTQPDEEAQQ